MSSRRREEEMPGKQLNSQRNRMEILGCAHLSQFISILAAQDEDDKLTMDEAARRHVFSNTSRRRRVIAEIGSGRPFHFKVFDPEIVIQGLYPFVEYGRSNSIAEPFPLVYSLEDRAKLGVYLDEDWIVAQVGIVSAHMRRVIEAFGRTDDIWNLTWRDCLVFQEHGPRVYFRDDGLTLDWAIATHWLWWEQRRDPWKQRCNDLEDLGYGSLVVRTLQRHAKELHLRYLADRTPPTWEV